MPPTTAVIFHPDCENHQVGPGHPENPARIRALLAALEAAPSDLRDRVVQLEARHAAEDEIALVHPRTYIELIRSAVERATELSRLVQLDPDTAVSPGSWNAALAAAGAVLTAVDALVEESAGTAFCAVRPPGHHATADRATGFCLFNNVAIGARYAQSRGLARALILDWDVHHGNGTEAIFYEDADVYYLSMHQSPHYPGTGAATHRGRGRGRGRTLNLPVPPGLPPERYLEELGAGIAAALSDFRPDIIFVSAGFDAAQGDPLAGLTLRPGDYHALTRELCELAGSCCAGRIVSVLEGGYNLEALALCGLAHLRALAGLDLC